MESLSYSFLIDHESGVCDHYLLLALTLQTWRFDFEQCPISCTTPGKLDHRIFSACHPFRDETCGFHVIFWSSLRVDESDNFISR